MRYFLEFFDHEMRRALQGSASMSGGPGKV